MSLAPAHFAEIKKEIAASYPDFEKNAIRSWGEILDELAKAAVTIKNGGPDVRLIAPSCIISTSLFHAVHSSGLVF